MERTLAWIGEHRRTVRDYECLPASHEAMITWAMIALMARRLAQPAHYQTLAQVHRWQMMERYRSLTSGGQLTLAANHRAIRILS